MPVFRPSRLRVLCASVLAGTVLVASPAQAAPVCAPSQAPPRVVLDGQGVLESAVVDAHGRLLYTDSDRRALMRLDRPGARPVQVAGGIDSPGGLAFDADERFLLVGQGNGVRGGVLAPVSPSAALLRVDLETGATTTYARGLAMANGVVRADDGTVYASDDVSATGVDRILPDGTVQVGWAPTTSANGLAIDAAGRRLFVAHTFEPARVSVVDLDGPPRVRTFATAPPEDVAAGLDGMDIDRLDRPVVAANGAGQVWRVRGDGTVCVLGGGLLFPSAVAYGRGPEGTFADGRLYAVTFSGVVAEVPGGFVAPAAG